MSVKNVLSLCAALLVGYSVSPSFAGDIISCDSFENCPDGSEVLTNQLIQLENKINALEALLAGVSRGTDPNTSQDTLTFTNMNVQVVNGLGGESVAINGTGNLIIGYNELRVSETNDRTGSHMLVLGAYNNYTSLNGMVAGSSNTTSSIFASVSGGMRNTASGMGSSVSGGVGNLASGEGSSVSGGSYNDATGRWSSISGGGYNLTSADYSSVSGGNYNDATGWGSSVSGGHYALSSSRGSSVSGGFYNVSSGKGSSVSGGASKTASGEFEIIGDDG